MCVGEKAPTYSEWLKREVRHLEGRRSPGTLKALLAGEKSQTQSANAEDDS